MKNLPFALKRNALTTIATAILIFFGITDHSYTQDEAPIFTQVSYMKVKQGNANKYVDVERNIWKPVHAELVKQGKIIGWYLYQIQYTGTGDSYNYATVTHYQGSDNMSGGYNEAFQKAHPNLPNEYISQQTNESRELVTSQLFEWRLQSFPEEQREPGAYIVVNYHRASGDYFALRRDIIKPAFDQSIKDGNLEGWGLWSTLFPSGADMPYNFVTADIYKDFSQVGNNQMGQYIEKLNPDKNLDEIWQKLGDTRKMARRELWRLVDYTD